VDGLEFGVWSLECVSRISGDLDTSQHSMQGVQSREFGTAYALAALASIGTRSAREQSIPPLSPSTVSWPTFPRLSRPWPDRAPSITR
jgi:hypothetical protein